MGNRRTDLSLKEAAAIAEVPEAAVRKAVEAGTLRPRVVQAGRARRHRFRARDLVYVKVVTSFPWGLPRADKDALFQIIENRRPAAGRWRTHGTDLVVESEIGEMRLSVAHVRATLAARLRAYARGRRRVESDPRVMGGEPVFAGTRIPVAHVAGLLAKKVPLDELREDYPSLTEDDVAFASMLAVMKPNPGRPRTKLALTRGGREVETVDRRVVGRAAPPR
jgi:uncharacterized protein (DUF433 family)